MLICVDLFEICWIFVGYCSPAFFLTRTKPQETLTHLKSSGGLFLVGVQVSRCQMALRRRQSTPVRGKIRKKYETFILKKENYGSNWEIIQKGYGKNTRIHGKNRGNNMEIQRNLIEK